MAARNVLRIIAVVLQMALLSAASGCFLLPVEEQAAVPELIKPGEVQYRTIEVERGEIAESILLKGIFKSAREGTLSFTQRGGIVKQIYVEMGQSVNTGDIIIELDTGLLESTKQNAHYTYQKSLLELDYLKSIGANKYKIQIAELDCEIANIAYQTAQSELDKARLYAPFDGIITYLAPVKTGQEVEVMKVIAKVSDPESLHLVIQGNDALKLHYANEVNVSFRIDYQSVEYDGIVVQSVNDNPNDLLYNTETYATIVDVPKAPYGDIQIGTEATITYILDQKYNVIVIPRTTVATYNERSYVYVLEDGKKTQRNVVLGLSNETDVEVLEGLAEDDLLIID